MNAEFARILSADDVDAAYSLLTRFQSFRKSHDLPSEGIKLGWDRERPDITTLALSDESRGVVDEFLVSRQKRFDEVDASEQALRDELVGKLNLILMGKNLRPEDRESLTKTIDFLKADYTFGIRGLLLFEVDDELPDEALTAVKQFVEQTTGLREELTAGHQSAVRDLARKQKLVRVKLIQQEEYVRAFGAMASVDLLTPWFEPIAVMADKYSHRRDASIAEVLDVRESEVLLRYQYQSGSKWCPRSNVFYAPGDFPGPRPEEIDLPDEPAPGLSVLPGTRLRPWQQVLATTGVFWKEAKIVDVTLIGIKVRWDGDTSKTHDTVVHRAQLRIPGKPGAQAAIPDAHGILPELLGGTGGAPFRTVSPTGKPVTGIRVTTEEWAGISCIRRIEPHWDRTLENDPITVVAREKYALGAVHVEAEKYVYALKFEFMRIGADGLLNAEDSYVSDWFGTPGRVEVRILTGQGRPVIGFFGRHLAVLDSVGAEFRSSGEK